MKINLYIDFDGVILDTINNTYGEYEKLKKTTSITITEYYEKLNWVELLENSNQINDSILNIKKILDSDLYNVCILTHVVCDDEVYAKKKYLSSVLPEVEVITVDKKFNKCDVVDCRNAILVDDYMGNLTLWNDKGGIPVKFSDKGRECEFMVVTNLEEIINLYDIFLEKIDGQVVDVV